MEWEQPRRAVKAAKRKEKKQKETDNEYWDTADISFGTFNETSIDSMEVGFRSFPIPLHYGNGHIPTRRVMFVLMGYRVLTT